MWLTAISVVTNQVVYILAFFFMGTFEVEYVKCSKADDDCEFEENAVPPGVVIVY